MTTITQRVSKRSLDFKNQKKAYFLRYVRKEPWETIAEKVVNLKGITGLVRRLTRVIEHAP